MVLFSLRVTIGNVIKDLEVSDKWAEFKAFIESADKELWGIFHSVDQDSNGKIDKTELHAALERAGISTNRERLQEFFEFMDKNRDGVISFEEWR